MITMETKLEIITKYEEGMRIITHANTYGRNLSTIRTIIKNKEAIKTKKEIAGDTLTQSVISHKASAIFADLVEAQRDGGHKGTSQQAPQEFKAPHGWFDRFRKRTGIHSVIRHEGAASSDKKAAEKFFKNFENVISRVGYIPQQVFNCDETGLFWKKMPCCTYITAEERKLPGHKPMNDRLTLAFCANASGDLKIKPLLVYYSENPCAYKAQNITKERLSVFWKSNAKAGVTRTIFIEWINVCFGPAVKNYLKENDIPLICLLVMDNAPAHPPGLEDIIHPDFSFIKMIDTAWNEVSRRTLNSSWKKLWPADVAEQVFEGFDPSTEDEAVDDSAPEGDVEELISILRSMGIVVDEANIHNLLEELREELTTEHLKELETMQLTIIQEEQSSSGGEDHPRIGNEGQERTELPSDTVIKSNKLAPLPESYTTIQPVVLPKRDPAIPARTSQSISDEPHEAALESEYRWLKHVKEEIKAESSTGLKTSWAAYHADQIHTE
ncbi:tigger transposable element-derived protein 1-like [Palaemon carinicauda]|uniref:tigger transposable element-derived protein 1-like n=1 Tax=Palaemon carinicauda TaxID=392227 RepID=UPI0035B66652